MSGRTVTLTLTHGEADRIHGWSSFVRHSSRGNWTDGDEAARLKVYEEALHPFLAPSLADRLDPEGVLPWRERKRAAFAELLERAEDGTFGDTATRADFYGFLDAYALLTGQDEETVYEDVQAALQARHEQALMEEA